MEAVVYAIVQSVIAGGEEHKSILCIYSLKHQVHNRMNEIVVEFENKRDEQGNFLLECERPWWSIANFKSNTREFSMRIEVVESVIKL